MLSLSSNCCTLIDVLKMTHTQATLYGCYIEYLVYQNVTAVCGIVLYRIGFCVLM